MLQRNSLKRKSNFPTSKHHCLGTPRPMTSLPKGINKRPNISLISKSKIPISVKKIQSAQLINPNNFFTEKLEKDVYFNQHLSNAQILQKFNLMSHIGKGSFSIVQLAIEKNTKTPHAIKTYEKIDNLDWHKLKNIKREIENLSALQHDNVISLKHVLKDKKKILLVMQNGGKQSLAGLLRKDKKFTEVKAKQYFKQILKAMSYCHSKNICHRDLKLENILVDDNDHVKVIDFGFSIDTTKKLNTYCGTPPYMCPQIVKKVPYNGKKADIWSLGIIFYLMLYGQYPFRATTEQQLYRLIQKGKYQLKSQISAQANQFISKMLDTDNNGRATAQELLQDKFII